MIHKTSAICAIFLLCACGIGSKGDRTPSPAAIQTLVSANGDILKYVGNWSSCTPQTNGRFNRNNISFSSDGADLVFIPATGIVGSFYDSACTQDAREEAVGVNPIAGFAAIAAVRGQVVPALRLYAAVEFRPGTISASMLPTDQQAFDRNVVMLRAQFDEATFNAV